MARHVDTADYQRLVAASRSVDPVIRKAFKKHLKDAGGIGAQAAKAKVLAMPTYGLTAQRTWVAGRGWIPAPTHHGRRNVRGRSHGLRRVLASGVKVQVGGKDVKIVQSTIGIAGRNARGVPRHLDAGVRWKHPFFGHGEVWQRGYSYFKEEIADKKEEMLREVGQVLDALQRHLR